MEKRCRHCGKHPEYKSAVCFSTFHYLHERDLLGLAQDYPAWRHVARTVGFSDEKIDAPWPHADEGRRVRIGVCGAFDTEGLWGPIVRAVLSLKPGKDGLSDPQELKKRALLEFDKALLSEQKPTSNGEDADGDAHRL